MKSAFRPRGDKVSLTLCVSKPGTVRSDRALAQVERKQNPRSTHWYCTFVFYSQLFPISQVLGCNPVGHSVQIKSNAAVLPNYNNGTACPPWEHGEKLYQLLSLTQPWSVCRGASVGTHEKMWWLTGHTDSTERRTHHGQHVHVGLWCCRLQHCLLVWKLTWIYNASQP